jgi:Tol biopolymer transport system component
MNGISHKQAIHLIHRRLDGMLKDSQILSLDEHLQTCEACRSYAHQMELLPSQLHVEFHSRWDAQDGPSSKVMRNIRSSSRRITMSNRLHVGFRALKGVAVLLIFGLLINLVISQMRDQAMNSRSAETPSNFPSLSGVENGPWIAFTMEKHGNMDIYLTHPDGSNLVNLTDHTAKDYFPIWSPDGTRLAFVSDRDGNENIYMLTLEDGALNRITDDASVDTAPVWSPDGSRIAYLSGDLQNTDADIYVMDANGKSRRRLTHYAPGTIAWPAIWSPDGRSIFFNAKGSIVRVNVENGETSTITPKSKTNTQYYTLAPDGSTFSYLTQCHDTDSDLCFTLRTIDLNDPQPDFTQSLATFKTTGHCPLGISASWLGVHIKWSPDQTKIMFALTCEEKGWLYIANADGSDFKPLTNIPLLGNGSKNEVATGDWSPDGQSIIFMSSLEDAESNSLYLINVNDALENPDLRPSRLNSSITQASYPVWQPVAEAEEVTEPRLLAFTSEKDGDLDIYTMYSDGSGLTNLTNNPVLPAQDVSPVWSPDGKQIAFESDRNGFRQIFLMNADGSNVVALTGGKDDQTDEPAEQWIGEPHNRSLNLWSPDGSNLIFLEVVPGDENGMLYIIDAKGENKKPLVKAAGRYSSPSWSPDGKHIAFIAQEGRVSRIYSTDTDGKYLTHITKKLSPEETLYPVRYSWSPDGQSIAFIATTWNVFSGGGEGSPNDEWRVYEVGLDGNTLISKASARSQIGGYWWDGSYFVSGSSMISSSPAFTWLRSDGKVTTSNPISNCQEVLDLDTGGYISGYSSYKQSPNGNVVIGAYCPNGDKWLFWADSKGTFRQLLNFPIHVASAPTNAMHVWAVPDFIWSSDDHYITFNIFTLGTTDMYIVNVADALEDPSTQPFKITIGNGSLYYSPAWQPLH